MPFCVYGISNKSNKIFNICFLRCGIKIPTENHLKKVKEWRDKWKNVFEEDEGSWLLNMEVKPATIYRNPKTQKDGWLSRHIISCCGTAIENVAKWLEVSN